MSRLLLIAAPFYWGHLSCFLAFSIDGCWRMELASRHILMSIVTFIITSTSLRSFVIGDWVLSQKVSCVRVHNSRSTTSNAASLATKDMKIKCPYSGAMAADIGLPAMRASSEKETTTNRKR